MAVICTVLASSGFVAAGYADTSFADAAVSRSPQTISRIANPYDEAAAIGFDPVAAQEPDVKISFAQLYVASQKIQSRKPAAQQVLDLTDPNGNTPHLSRGPDAVREDVPEISLDEISKVRRDILTAAYVGLGHPYVWGGTSFEHGWDCSGFVQWAYAHAGIALPRTEQWVPMVETNNPQPGDIVVQNPDGPYHWSHIGIYVGNGKMISALNPSVGTILHAPAATSSSSTYFTIPAFATADEQARDEAAANKANGVTPTASATASPKPTPTKSATAKPATTKPATTSKPGTTPTPTTTKSATPTAPATTKPATPTPTTPPATVPPTTVPTTPTPTPTEATTPATTAPATTTPTTAPAPTTQPAPTPSATAPATTEPATTDPEPTAPEPTTQTTTAPATTTEAVKTAAPTETPTPSSFTTVSPTAVETTAGTKTADQTRTQSTTTDTPTSQTPISETPSSDPTAVPSQ